MWGSLSSPRLVPARCEGVVGSYVFLLSQGLALTLSKCGELARARASPAGIWQRARGWLTSGAATSLFCQATGEAQPLWPGVGGSASPQWDCGAALVCLCLMLVMGVLCPRAEPGTVVWLE